MTEFSSDVRTFCDDEMTEPEPSPRAPTRQGGKGPPRGSGRERSPHFNPIYRDGKFKRREEDERVVRSLPPAPTWMQKPLKPPTRKESR